MTDAPLGTGRSTRSLAADPGLMAMLWAMGIASFLVGADNRALTPMLPAIASDLHVRESMAGLLVTAYSVPYGLFQLGYGPIADKIGKLRTITLALSLFAFCTIACGLVGSYSTLLALRIITGIFAAGIIPISLAQIGDRFPLSERPRALALFMGLNTSGIALGIALGGIMAEFVSYKVIFFVIGASALPAVLLLSRQLAREPKTGQAATIPLGERYRRIFTNPRSWTVYGSIFLEGMIFFGGFTFIGVYAVQTLGLSYMASGLITCLYSLATLVGSRLIVRTLQRVGQHRMPVFGVSLMGCGYGVIWLFPNVAALAIGLTLFGFGYSFAHSTFQTYATELLPEARATCMSLFAFFFFLGIGIGPAGLGWLYDIGGISLLLGSATGLMFLFALFCWRVYRNWTNAT
jgi:predicted MFS family arabinose efflux permease